MIVIVRTVIVRVGDLVTLVNVTVAVNALIF